MKAKPGSGESPIIKTYTYEPIFNKLATYVDPKGALTTFNYDTKGNLIGMTQPAVTGGSPYTDFTYNNSGLLINIIDARGMSTGFTYDPNSGDLLSTTVSQASLNLTTQVTYDPVGNQITITDPLGHTTGYQYDPARLITQITAPAPLSYVTKYSYDANGRLVKTEQETGDSENPWQAAILSYTATGKLESYMNTMGNSSTAQYDPADRLWKTTDAENHTREYLYNSFGQIQRLVGALGETEREYSYNDNGLTQSLTDASGNTTIYEYDGFDRLTETTYPDGSSKSFSYDSTGNLTQKKNRVGEFIDYGYDDLRRLVFKRLPGPKETSYTYDLTGLLTDLVDPGGNIHYSYDSAGRLTAATYPGGKTVGYGYDNGSNRNRLTYPDGYYITYDYDALNRLTEIKESGDTSLAQYEYDPLSRRTVMNCGNGTSATYTWDEDNKLINLENRFNSEAVNFSDSYDKIGNKLSMTVDDDRFSFKPQNIINSDYVSNNLNQYASVQTTSFTYDNNGNLTFDGNNHYTYNPDNRLVGVNTPIASAAYSYNPLGWRTSKEVDGQTTSYIHDNDQVIMEYDNSGQLRRRYIYGPKIDQPVCMKDNGDVYYYHLDGGGSVVALTDNSGNVVETYAYNAYGMTDDLSELGNPYLYTGREYDSESGLYYYRARHYNPVYGRFLQVDPIGYKDGMNMYAYTKNNPINWSDPHGLTSLAEQFYIEVMVDLGRIFQLTQSQTDQLKSSANSVAQIAAGTAGIGLFLITAPASVPMALAGLAGAFISYIGIMDGLLNLLSWDWYNEALHPDTGMFEEAGKNIGVVCEMKETGQSIGKVADVASIFFGVSVTRSATDAGLAITPIIMEMPSLLKK
ncbi:MAG: hypothetical protein DRH03_07625 [Deltaproteobacteria bacterium]|nr:MAG: hypothetical protein DRH03_07625 [Deltaproteobacteria bacterium]